MAIDCLKFGPKKADSSRMIRVLVILITLPIRSTGTACFRRARQEEGSPICRGKIQTPFNSPQACCQDSRATAFAHTLSRVSGRRYRYHCTPCHALHALEAVHDVMTLHNTSPSSTSTTTAVPTSAISAQPVWGEWSEWSSCSITCGAGLHIRQRQCNSDDVTLCQGPYRQGRPCQLLQHCPVDGNWGPWFPWTPCSASCGPGTRFRERLCANPPPALGGLHCKGRSKETKACDTRECPVDGGWGEWTPWSECNATCGRGRRTRVRRCDNPHRENGGKKCKGRRRQRKRCNLPQCPVDGGWTLWSRWSQCSATCGEGIRTRRRECISPSPEHGGANCPGRSEKHRKCTATRAFCPVDGGWSLWGEWSSCDGIACSNVPGFQQRLRLCANPTPQFGGSNCEGARFDRTPCLSYSPECPEPGAWCDWDTWGECELFKGRMVRERRRKCECPAPQNGGLYCQGPSFEEEEHCSPTEEVMSEADLQTVLMGDKPTDKCGTASGSGAENDDNDTACDQEVEEEQSTESHDQADHVTPI